MLDDAYWGLFPRERTRSPPRRNYATQHGRRQTDSLLQAQFASALAGAPLPDAPLQGQSLEAGLLNRVCSLVGRLKLDAVRGDAAWSENAALPVRCVFDRLRAHLTPAPTVAQVELALEGLEAHLRQAASDGHDNDAGDTLGNLDGNANDVRNDIGEPDNNDTDGGRSAADVDALFTTLEPTALLPPTTRRTRRRHSFDMSAVRRSARLAKKPAIPAVERAQRNLCRKLGLQASEADPIDLVLRDYLDMFKGPLPPQVIDALTAIFRLDHDDTEVLDAALLQHAGPGVMEVAIQAEEP
jgi:hypothetical protein